MKSHTTKYSIAIILATGILLLTISKSLASGATNLFYPYVNFSITRPQAVGIGDFNNDGKLDAVVTTEGNELKVFLQNQSGSLASAATYATGSRPESIAIGDLNHDGWDDVVVANFANNTISVFIQQPDGTLASQVSYATGAGPDAVAVGDINGDGLDDVAVSNWNSSHVSIFTQNSNGTLNTSINYTSPQAGSDDIAIGDVNGDGLNDVVKMNGQLYANPDLSVYLQTHNGTLANAVSYSLPGNILGKSIGLGDITGDGKVDVVMSYGGNRPSSNIAVFAQAEDGSLLPAVSYSAYDVPEAVDVADVNGDGSADVVAAHGGWNAISVFAQQTNGTLGSYSAYPLRPYSASHFKPQALTIGDINNDSLPDVLVANSNFGLDVFYHLPVDTTHPSVISITRFNPNPTSAASVNFTVTLSEAVTGVSISDFALSTTGNLVNTAITAVNGSGSAYTVTVSTGTGSGTLRLDIPATATIMDQAGNPLSSLPYTNGQAYTIELPIFGKSSPANGAVSQSTSPTLSWKASAGAIGYEYCYSSVPGPCTKWNSVGTNTSVSLSGLAPNRTYYWQVQAINTGGTTEADSDSWWSFTTTATPVCTFPPHTIPTTASFVDVPMNHWAWNWIERYKSAGLTTGCSWVPGGFCPGDNVTREQMAVFIMRAKRCGNYTPTTVTSAVFTDVPASHWAAGFIRDFRDAKITSGCAWVPGGYCPGDNVTREQMAVFIIRAIHGGTYSPPAVTEAVFTDVTADHWAATFIKQLYDEGITTGCTWVPDGYCPGDLVTREQMAVFIGKAFNLLP